MAAILFSSMFSAHWSALTNGYNYSHMELEKTDTDLLRPSASLLNSKILPTKLNASFSSDL